MSEDFTYRVATIADKHALKNLAVLSYGQFAGQLSEAAWLQLKTGLNDEQKLADLIGISKCFVCEAGDKLVGMAHIILHGHPWDIFPAEWAYIRLVGVDPAFGGRGIAKELTNRCVDYARQNGEKTIALHTSEMMNAARHIYEHLGFSILKEIEPRFGKRYWLYTLSLD